MALRHQILTVKRDLMSISSRSLTLVVSISTRYLMSMKNSFLFTSRGAAEMMLLMYLGPLIADVEAKNWNVDHLKTHENAHDTRYLSELSCIRTKGETNISQSRRFWLHKQWASAVVWFIDYFCLVRQEPEEKYVVRSLYVEKGHE